MHMHEFPSDYIVVTYFGSTIPYFVAPAGYPTDRILTILKINTGWKKAFLQDAKGRRVRNLRKPLVPEIPYSFNPGSDRGILGTWRKLSPELCDSTGLRSYNVVPEQVGGILQRTWS